MRDDVVARRQRANARPDLLNYPAKLVSHNERWRSSRTLLFERFELTAAYSTRCYSQQHFTIASLRPGQIGYLQLVMFRIEQDIHNFD
jgi:hypothetical protein